MTLELNYATSQEEIFLAWSFGSWFHFKLTSVGNLALAYIGTTTLPTPIDVVDFAAEGRYCTLSYYFNGVPEIGNYFSNYNIQLYSYCRPSEQAITLSVHDVF